jgi:shikimate dehydrogenase
VLARRPEQAAGLVADLARHCPGRGLAAHAWPDLVALSQRPALALVVNSTPLGMTPQPHASPWPDTLPFPAGAVAYDLVYNPRQTRFMRQAQAAGSRAMNGLGMLVQQGALAFAWWTGSRPDVAVMTAAINHEEAG